MIEPVPSRRLLQFAVFEVDLDARELRKRGSRVRLPQQAFHVLQVLLERRGRVVTRDELQRSLWPAETYVEFDHGLNNAISRLRDVLDDSSKQPRFIETIQKVGYRFIAPVTSPADAIVEAAAPAVAEVVIEAAHAAPLEPPRAPMKRRWLAPAFVVVMFTLVVAITWQLASRHTPAALKSLAVLPLNYVGPDGPSEDYIADGMTGALITELSKLEGVRVISETSSRRFAKTTKSLPDVARELGVEAIVEGSVLREGTAVRVTVQLVRASDDSHVWADTYTRGMGSVLALQSEVAMAIASAIGEHYSPEERRQMTNVRVINPDAYRLYVSGRQLRRKSLESDIYGAIDHFEQAIAIEPEFARAYAGISEAWIALAGWMGSVLPKEGFPKAKAAAERALAIDPGLVEANVALAYVTEVYDWNLKAAERLYQHALELSPNDAMAWDRYAQHLNRTGRFKEGVERVRRAYELNPLSVDNLIGLGGRLVDSGKFDEGLAMMRKAIDLEPENFEPWSHIAENYSRAKRLDDAIAAGKRGVELSRQGAHALQMLATIYANNGRLGDASALLKILEAAGPKRNPHTVAMLHLRLGNAEQALRWLETACEERTMQIGFLQFQQRSTQFDPIRKNPRFDRVVRCGQPSGGY